MKQYLTILCVCIVACSGFLLKNTCTTDADCNTGMCCKQIGDPSTPVDKPIMHCHLFRQENQTCRLDLKDLANCGCAKGLVCSSYTPQENQLYYGSPLFTDPTYINKYGLCQIK